AGTYKYTIKEVKAGTTENGITYDDKTITATVTVTDDGKGVLSAEVTYDGGTTFTNTYSASKTKASLEVTKKLTGRATGAQAGEFEFTLTDNQDNSVKDTAKNDKDGNVQFKELEFDKAGTYTYTIKEVKAGTTEKGITYDSKTITATVTVTDDGKGTLSAEVAYDGDTTFTNTYSASKTKASLEATKELTGRELQDGEFEFTLTDSNNNLVDTVKNTKDGKVQFKELEFDTAGTYTYKIAEKSGDATGVTYDSKTITATVTVTDDGEGNLSASVAYDDSTPFSNTYTPAGDTSVTLGAKKVLEGKVLEAGKYSFVLKEGDKVLQTVTNDADGNVKFAPIAYNESQVGTHKYTISEVSGSETGITYDTTVHEVEVTVKKVSATELTATVSKEAKDLVFTNKYTPGKTQIPVKKVWKDADNQDGKRVSSVTVKLYADGKDTGKKLELSEANGWAGTFTDLDADKGGVPITYTVVEETAVPGYNTEITGDAKAGFTITNSYTPETVNIKATKNWDDANNQDGKRPTKITVNLLADGTKVDSKEIQAAPDGTWSVEFTNLAKYKNGKEIKYTVTEEAVAEYDSYINDFNITNKYTPKTIDYKVTKVWKDANNQDGKRPKSVTIQLYKSVGGSNPVAVEGKKLTLTDKDKTDENTWVASFTNLPQFEAGKEITYSIKELDVPAGYESSVTGQVVTNTHNPETVVLSGTKVWKDNNNQDGKRTTSVKVQILKGDQVVQEIEVSEKTGWKFESKPLPKYENGKEITYTVKEVVVKEYKTTITTDKDGKYTITNEHTPEKINVKGKKTWDDANNKDGIRPDSIT
ncbi:Cna B-type domain-containing protein, partial [Falseniella ignava]